MEVTKSNFNKVLETIEPAIGNSTFISVDCELTGLNIARNINTFDTPAAYYEKVRRNIKEFLVIQYGISLFRFDEKTDSFKQQSYNFYIFRVPVNRSIPDQRFLCQTSSINFLIQQGFDFNKLFKEGISYMNVEEENAFKTYLEERQEFRLNQKLNGNPSMNVIAVPEKDQTFIDEIIEKLEKFLESEESDLTLPKCNAFLRRLIYQTVSQKFFGKLFLETKALENQDRILVASKPKTQEEENDKLKEKIEEETRLLDDCTGFTKILRMIVNSGKLVIGHNMCLDLLHTLDKFLTPLPENYEEFKEVASSLFTRILDTKYMSSVEPLQDLIPSNILKPLLETVSAEPFQIPKVEIEEGKMGYNITDNKEHEAGYDAFITGLSFISMWKYLGQKMENRDIFKNLNLLKPYINRIFLMTLADNQYINIGGEDANPSRDHVFHLEFPREWRVHNLTELFSPFGNVQISWLDSTSAYIGLIKKDQAPVALSTLSQSSVYKIMTYHRHQELKSGRLPPVAPREVQKRKSSSEFSTEVGGKKRKLEAESGTSNTDTENPEDQWEVVTKKGKRKAVKTFKESNWE